MNVLCEMTEDKHTQTLELAADQRLVIERYAEGSLLRIIGRNGKVSLAIHVTEDGPVVRLEGSAVEVEAQGQLSLNAEHVSIHGRKSLSLTSDGNVSLDTPADIHSNARSQKITARLGNVDIKANDDVTMDGERIRMNC
ncbi:hypothetical protein HQ563_01880 [bacterium]|nr:hypothetical protein [bacterium]